MPNKKITAMPDLAGGQVPTDLATLVDLSALPASQNVKSSLNNLFSVVTRNITDGALRFGGFAAPAVSAAGAGSIYFDSTANAFRISQNAGAYVGLATVGGANTQLLYNNAGVIGGVTGATSNGTNVTYGAGNLRATSPLITTGINDANNLPLILATATGSAVNQFTIANAATGNGPTLSATGTDSNIPIVISPLGTGVLNVTKALTLSGGVTTTYTTPQANAVPTAINVVNFTPANFGQIVALGIPDTSPTNARVLSCLDARTVAHQPSIACFSPDENNLIGFSWDGSNSIGYVKNTSGLVGLQGRIIQGVPSSAPTDANFANNQGGFWVDEVGTLVTFRFRDSGGTMRTGTFAYV